MHLPGRAAGIGQHGREAADRAPHDAGQHSRPRRQALKARAKPMPQHEHAGDEPDGQANMGGRECRRE